MKTVADVVLSLTLLAVVLQSADATVTCYKCTSESGGSDCTLGPFKPSSSQTCTGGICTTVYGWSGGLVSSGGKPIHWFIFATRKCNGVAMTNYHAVSRN